MMNPNLSLQFLSGRDLLSATRELVRKSHVLEADLLVHLGEVDERKLYLECSRPSMFAFCVEELGFSEDAAYNRITVARAGRRVPAVIEAARSGRVHLAGLRRLAPHLTAENHEAVLAEAAGKSKREIEVLVARLCPLPPVPATIRRLPECPLVGSSPWLRSQSPIVPARDVSQPSPAQRSSDEWQPSPATIDKGEPIRQIGAELAPLVPPGTAPPQGADFRLHPARTEARRSAVTPLTGETFKIEFTAGRSLRDKLQEAQDLLRHRLPDGNMAVIFERGLDLLIAQVKKERFAVGRKARMDAVGQKESTSEGAEWTTPSSRHIPDAIKRAVYERDGGRCTFVDEMGRRCTATALLEFDHMDGFALTHQHDVDRIRLLCRAHNQYVAEQLYGRAFMDRARAGKSDGEPVAQSVPESSQPVPGPVPDVAQLVPGPVPDVAQVVPGPVPDVAQLVPGPVPDVVQPVPGPVPDGAQLVPGPVPGASQLVLCPLREVAHLVPGPVSEDAQSVVPCPISGESQLVPAPIPGEPQPVSGPVVDMQAAAFSAHRGATDVSPTAGRDG